MSHDAAAAELLPMFDLAPLKAVPAASIAITAALSVLDGFDVLSVSFAAPALNHTWGLEQVILGPILSSGLVGVARRQRLRRRRAAGVEPTQPNYGVVKR